MATCADILRVKPPDNAGEDSVSILPALLGTDRSPLREAIIYHSIYGRFSIQQRQWKLELCPGSGGWGQPGDAKATQKGLPSIQLYDMTADVGETHNVQADHPDIVARLTSLLEKYVTDGRSTPGVPEKNETSVDIWKKNLNGPAAKIPSLDD
jgi:arylsulfatase A